MKTVTREILPLPDYISIYILRQIVADAEAEIRKQEARIAEVLPELESKIGCVVEVVRWKGHKCMDW